MVLKSTFQLTLNTHVSIRKISPFRWILQIALILHEIAYEPGTFGYMRKITRENQRQQPSARFESLENAVVFDDYKVMNMGVVCVIRRSRYGIRY